MYMYVYVYACTCMCVCVCVYIRMYVCMSHTHTHTHTHTYAYRPQGRGDRPHRKHARVHLCIVEELAGQMCAVVVEEFVVNGRSVGFSGPFYVNVAAAETDEKIAPALPRLRDFGPLTDFHRCHSASRKLGHAEVNFLIHSSWARARRVRVDLEVCKLVGCAHEHRNV